MEKIYSRQDVLNMSIKYALDKYQDEEIMKKRQEYMEGNFIKDLIKKYSYEKDEKDANKKYVVYTRSLLSHRKLILPARGEFCLHSECANFDEMFEYIAQYSKCPICKKKTEINEIMIDTYFYTILQVISSGMDFEEIDLICIDKENLNWEILKN